MISGSRWRTEPGLRSQQQLTMRGPSCWLEALQKMQRIRTMRCCWRMMRVERVGDMVWTSVADELLGAASEPAW